MEVDALKFKTTTDQKHKTPPKCLENMAVQFASTVLALDGVLFVHETPKWLRGSENGTRASIGMGVSGKWLKFEFWGELSLSQFFHTSLHPL